jgi:hypothetical protein
LVEAGGGGDLKEDEMEEVEKEEKKYDATTYGAIEEKKIENAGTEDIVNREINDGEQ